MLHHLDSRETQIDQNNLFKLFGEKLGEKIGIPT